QEPSRRLLADCLSRSKCSISLAFNSLQRNVKRIRQRINLPLPIPSDAAHLIIPDQYKISFRNINFLLYDGKMKEKDFILFVTPPPLNILSRSSNIYFESTFKPVPEILRSCIEEFGEKGEKMFKSHTCKLPCVRF
ncbi:LOW QUALITY PROTEIN: hypothetical protein HZS_771, partial [Henneguya salminicola]